MVGNAGWVAAGQPELARLVALEKRSDGHVDVADKTFLSPRVACQDSGLPYLSRSRGPPFCAAIAWACRVRDQGFQLGAKHQSAADCDSWSGDREG